MSSAETNQAFSPTVLGSRRRAVGLTRPLNRRNSFKSPVLNAETCVTTASSNSLRQNQEVNYVRPTQLSTPDSSLPNVNDIAKSKATPSSSLTCKVRPNVRPNSNTSVTDSNNSRPTITKNKTSEVPQPLCTKDSLNGITPATSELVLNPRLQKSHEDSSPKVLPKGSSMKSAAKKCIGINARSQQMSTPSSSRKRPQTQRNIFGKKFKTDFKSPVRNVTVEESKLQIEESISDLKKRLQAVDDEIKNLQNSGYKLEEVQTFMTKLHEYNELKDIGQFLIGQIAFKEGTTTKRVYGRFGLNLED